jgi:hypothetical protein
MSSGAMGAGLSIKQPAMQPSLMIGVTASGIVDHDPNIDVDTKFKLAKASNVFDYIDRTPPPAELDQHAAAALKYRIPIKAGGFFYTLGRDEPLLDWHLRISRTLGIQVHNVQIRARDATGELVSNERVAQTYLWCAELGDKYGTSPSFEVHINMWSEHFGRVEEVGLLVERHGVPFNITLDHSHVIFKIDNPREQDVLGMRPDVESGKIVLDPFCERNITQQWISANWVRHAHARPASPANPVNIWATHPDGSFGRGVQYPFLEPRPGEWHSPWDARKLEPWKEVIRQLLRHHASHPESRLQTISLEMIPNIDYGAGAKYSIWENNVACAKWIRSEWHKTLDGNIAAAQR